MSERDESNKLPGPKPNPEKAYIKALLIKLKEQKQYITELRRYLVEHPLLVLEIGFIPEVDNSFAYGFDVEKTVPSDRWLRHKQQTLSQEQLQRLFRNTVHQLQAEIPNLGETMAIDTKHQYAWVKENNPRENLGLRYQKEQQPAGDPDCGVGVKRHLNQEKGKQESKKEYLWGYGTGVLAATSPIYGDVVLAEYTQTFDAHDVTYFRPLYHRVVETLGFKPRFFAADAAYDTWQVYEPFAAVAGSVAIPLNLRGRPQPQLDEEGFPLCPRGHVMNRHRDFDHTDGFRARHLRCPLLYPEPTGLTCSHEQFAKNGCVKYPNIELGGQMRRTIDRHSQEYITLYNQRSAAERINSQAKALGIERLKVRNIHSVRNLNTLIYVIINVQALHRVRLVNAQAKPP